MKYLPLLFIFMWSALAYGQDTIVQKNGNPIPAKVLEIDKSDVKYKKFENPEGPSYVIAKNDIILIRYQNGSVDSFTVAKNQKTVVKVVRPPKSEMYLKGFKDGQTYYSNYKPAAHLTFGLTIPLNAFGIIPAVVMSSTPPKKENLNYPDETLIKNPDYLTGYIEGAKNKKAGKVMKSFLLGALSSFVIYGTLVATGALHP